MGQKLYGAACHEAITVEAHLQTQYGASLGVGDSVCTMQESRNDRLSWSPLCRSLHSVSPRSGTAGVLYWCMHAAQHLQITRSKFTVEIGLSVWHRLSKERGGGREFRRFVDSRLRFSNGVRDFISSFVHLHNQGQIKTSFIKEHRNLLQCMACSTLTLLH